MIVFVLLLLFILGFGTGCTFGMMVLFVAMDVFLHFLLPEFKGWQYLVLSSLCLLVPLSVYFAGLILDHFSFSSIGNGAFRVVAMVLAFYLILNSNVFFGFFEAALSVIREGSPEKGSLLILAGLNASIFCAGLIAFTMMILHLGFELPVRWLSQASRLRLHYCFSAVRPLTILFGVTISFNLIIGLLVNELWPTTLLSLIKDL